MRGKTGPGALPSKEAVIVDRQVGGEGGAATTRVSREIIS